MSDPRPAARARTAHRYGDNVHVVADPYTATLLARLCSADCDAREAHGLVDACSAALLQAASEQLPTRRQRVPTRMFASEPRAVVDADLIDPEARAVVVDIARAGILPALGFHRGLMALLPPDRVRVDHIYLQRTSDPATGAVTGVHHAGSKIGGAVDGATLFVPDPMAATGSSLAYVRDVYRSLPPGPPRRIVACHLIATPEYLARVARDAPDVTVYTLRVDRGLSPDDVLRALPGERWAEERGLDAHSYIVPGAGGMGEVLNNAWV